jgi:pimeloyl-ACP methyl ester carboxylesterase
MIRKEHTMNLCHELTRLVAALAVAVPLLGPATPAFATAPHCISTVVPVSAPGVPDARIYGELCLPPGPPPSTVQLLVHSTWYNLRSWDTPQSEYSYVRSALAAGYATFNLDRLGTGRSTKPAAHLVTIDAVADTINQVVLGLRSGAVGGNAFSRVVWVGSSFGSAYGWVHGDKYPGQGARLVGNLGVRDMWRVVR